jgi:hypothetical protein
VQHRIVELAFAVVDFIHRKHGCTNNFSNFICSHRRGRLRVAFAHDDELHRLATRDNASRGSNEAQTRIASHLVMFDAPITQAVAETSAGDADEEE